MFRFYEIWPLKEMPPQKYLNVSGTTAEILGIAL
jgi:hypothetical protein